MAADRPHLTALVALGALSVATTITLTRVFAHAAWFAPALVAALAPIVITWYAVRYKWSTRTFVLVIGYGAAWWSAIVVNPDRTIAHVVPTAPGLLVWLRGLFDAPHVLRTAVVPVPPVGHALELALVALAVAAAGAAWSVAKHDGVLAALLPDFALFIAIASLGKGAYVGSTTLWCATAGAFLLAQHSDSVLRARTGFQAPGARRSRLVTGGAAAAVVAVVFGAIVGPRLPEAASAPLLDYHSLGHGGQSTQIVDISPLVGIRDRLNQPKPTVLFQVTSTAQARWRLMALDKFDGSFWSLSDDTPAVRSLSPNLPSPLPGVVPEPVDQQYTIGPMEGKFLPAAYRAVQTSHLGNAVVIADSATLVVQDESHQGLHYSVTSDLIGAPPATLERVPPVNPRDAVVQQNLQLPKSMSSRVVAEAKRVVASGTTEYDKALLLQNYFRDPKRFTYDQRVDLSESSNAMVDFLFNVRRGFCEQFAGTYAAMARAVGLPTRVAVGFQPGAVTKTTQDFSTYTVTTKEAHAWPEVYFPEVGWVAFEPTPQRYDYDTPGDPSGTAANAPPYSGTQPASGPTTTTPTTTASPATGPSATLPTKLKGLTVTPPGHTGGSQSSTSGHGDLAWLIVPGALLVALLSAVLAVAILQRARRWRRVHAPTARARVDGAWTQAAEDLARCDIRRRPAATLVEFALREAPAAGAGAAGPALLELAQIQTRAMYSADEPPATDADRAWECADTVGDALRAATPRRERIRQRLGLGPRDRRRRLRLRMRPA